MKQVEVKNKLVIGGKGILTATVKGTRKFDEQGRMIDPGVVVAEMETPNIVCNEGLQLFSGFIMDESAVYDVGYTYCEIGTDNTAPTATDTTLGTFSHRNAITSRSRSNYVITFATFFTAAECTIALEEAGIWGGSNAAAGEATGLLGAHWLASFDNTGGSYDITITYVLTVARG